MEKTKWNQYLEEYKDNQDTKQLIFVKYTGGTLADVILYCKNEQNTWKQELACQGYVGKNGIGKAREGDTKTPEGLYNIIGAFGINKDPGAKMDYLKVNEYQYWSAEKEYYNQLIDIREHPGHTNGEHLIQYVPQYNYGFFLDYNKECIYNNGSAIFFHCVGSHPYTEGCIAVAEENMIKLIKQAEPGTKICIGE